MVLVHRLDRLSGDVWLQRIHSKWKRGQLVGRAVRVGTTDPDTRRITGEGGERRLAQHRGEPATASADNTRLKEAAAR